MQIGPLDFINKKMKGKRRLFYPNRTSQNVQIFVRISFIRLDAVRRNSIRLGSIRIKINTQKKVDR